MTTRDLAGMTTAQLLKMQADIAAALAQKHDQEVSTAQTAEQKLRSQISAELKELSEKWAAKAETIAAPAQPIKAKAQRRNIKSTPAKVAPKYRDGSGHTWSGRGKKPGWITQAIAGGATLEQFRIQA
jgi:DNA-binding protein H-NS